MGRASPSTALQKGVFFHLVPAPVGRAVIYSGLDQSMNNTHHLGGDGGGCLAPQIQCTATVLTVMSGIAAPVGAKRRSRRSKLGSLAGIELVVGYSAPIARFTSLGSPRPGADRHHLLMEFRTGS